MNYFVVIVAALAVAGCGIVVMGRGGVRWGFLLWICTLGLGYRTLPVTDGFKLHPSVLLLIALFLWLVLTASSSVKTVWWAPLWLWALVPFWYWGWILGQRADFAWDEMLSELQSFVLFIPLFMVAATILEDKRDWKAVLSMFYWTSAVVAILGLLEYFYPGIRGIFPQFVSNTTPYVSEDGFARAPFSFWGHQAATFICAMSMPLVIPMREWHKGTGVRALIWGGLILSCGAVYLSGFRILWLMAVLQFVMWLLLSRRYTLGVIAAVSAAGSYAALPEATKLRAESFWLALEGTPVDTSGADHMNRLTDAANAVKDYPFGMGWTGSGWVHCDFLQVAANLGVIAGVTFAGAFLWTVYRLTKLALSRSDTDWPLHVALLLSLVTAGGIMSTQVICVLPQLAFPVWLIWALSMIALRQCGLRKEVPNAGTNFSFASYLQLRTNRAGYARIPAQRV